MANIAYIDHSYHKKTLSNKFLPDILEDYGHRVDWFWDESWNGGKSIDWNDISNYDVIIMFQSFSPIYGDYYKNKHHCITYIPMLDQFGIWDGPLFNLTDFWEPFQGVKVLNFSNSLHALVTGFGIKSKNVRYFQHPISVKREYEDELHGFIWIRREDQVSWKLIKKLIGNTHFDSFHIHATNDPGSSDVILPEEKEIIKYNIKISTWFDKKEDFDKVLNSSNVFFAPRMEEGIGQSFLEALNHGQCIVASNNGTMNEYIIDGITGLLYDHENPKALDFSNAVNIGIQAKKSADIGYKKWKEKEKEIVEFILTPNEQVYEGKYIHIQKERDTLSTTKSKWKTKLRRLLIKLYNIKNKLKKGVI